MIAGDEKLVAAATVSATDVVTVAVMMKPHIIRCFSSLDRRFSLVRFDKRDSVDMQVQPKIWNTR
jgi:hypothetical protein